MIARAAAWSDAWPRCFGRGAWVWRWTHVRSRGRRPAGALVLGGNEPRGCAVTEPEPPPAFVPVAGRALNFTPTQSSRAW